MPKYPREKGKPIDLPVYGDAEHNMGIYQAIGVLVINWGSDESVFLAMLQALLGGEKQTAIIMWLSFYNTKNRLDLRPVISNTLQARDYAPLVRSAQNRFANLPDR
jgi:hypothetical protein